jgi:phage FluMu protein Com
MKLKSFFETWVFNWKKENSSSIESPIYIQIKIAKTHSLLVLFVNVLLISICVSIRHILKKCPRRGNVNITKKERTTTSWWSNEASSSGRSCRCFLRRLFTTACCCITSLWWWGRQGPTISNYNSPTKKQVK